MLAITVVCGLLGLGVTYLLLHFSSKPGVDAVKRCLEHLEVIRDLSAHGDQSMLPEIQSRLAHVRRLSKKFDIESVVTRNLKRFDK